MAVMDYGQFLEDVRKRGGFASNEEAMAVASHVLMAVAEVLPQRDAEGITTILPPELLVYLRPTHAEPDPNFDSQLFLGWVVSTVDATGGRDKTGGGLDIYADYSGDEAIRRCQCVFSVLKSLMSDRQQATMLACLPEEVGVWFSAA